ncbi:MAG: RNA polymerase sigma factor [Steroidobacteraceae bacterium]
MPEVPEPPEVAGDCAGTAAPQPERIEALAEISRNHYAALVRFLSVRTGSVADAEEIVQEAFAKMLALDRPGTISFLASYVWRVAVNLATDRTRQRVLHERYARALPQVETRACSAESTVEARQRLAIVERAIGNLPPRCLEAFILHVMNGLTFDEVGREMRISGRMAQKHLARALEYLQSCLDSADATRSTR